MQHADEYGEGAKARRSANLSEPEEYEAVQGEFNRGTLHAGGSGDVVTNPAQAKAIAASENRRKKNNSDNPYVAKRR